jgi:PEP-CTERM motif
MITKQLKSFLFAMCAIVLCAASASAGSVRYNFIEGSPAPDPGTVGAFFVFASPPASATSGWNISNVADVLDFEITDPKISTVGSYLKNGILDPPIVSNDGTSLDQGGYTASGPGNLIVEVDLGPNAGQTLVLGLMEAAGDFVLAPAAVPEPSSLILAGTAALAGLGCWMRRRGR